MAAKERKKPTKSAKKRKGSGEPRTYRGKRVEDYSGKQIPFVVTNQDCKRGKPNKPGECAGACALKRHFPGCIDVFVHRTYTYVEYKDKVVRHKTGYGLRDQSIRYDAAKKFDPGVYVLGPISASTIAARGKAHTPTDIKRGDPNSPKRRQKGVALRHHVGRQAFTFTAENSDFR